MTRMHKIHRSGVIAVAAALALSSTPALAQDFAPVVTTDPVAPVLESPLTIPLAEEPAPAEAAPVAPIEPVAIPEPAPSAEAVPVAEPVNPETIAPRTSATARSTPVANEATRLPTEGGAVTEETGATGEGALPAPATAPRAESATSKEASGLSSILPIASVAILGLLGLIVAARLLPRRNSIEADAPVTVAHEEAPAVATSAALLAVKGSLRAAPTTGIAQPMPAGGPSFEAAYAGPTPDNPSLSLKHRLKRASFFAQRQRLAATGKASPLSRFAGLPKRVVEQMRAAGRGFTTQAQMAY